MTIQEVSRTYKRICVIHREDFCEGCPLLPPVSSNAEGCLDAMISHPDEFEKALLDWAEENPVPTNRDKFFEVFGISEYPPLDDEWWDEEYIERKKEEV